jgi:phospholipid-binding lipoprotein MlaA
MRLSRYILVLVLVLPAIATAQEQLKNPDPFESFNRGMFAVNDVLDRFMIRPLAKGYDWVTPDPIQRGVGNLFANMYDFNSAINGVLQWRWEGVAQSSGRFLVNSTVGLLGVFDVATRMGMRPYRTDFGHTLAIWGVDAGPYLMVPFFGPRTMRSGAGTIFDTYTSIPTYIDNVRLRNSLWGLELVDGRARLLNTEDLMSGDRYIFIRDAYLQQRETFVNDGVVQDDFSDFREEGEWEDF